MMETRLHSTPLTPIAAKQYVSDMTGVVVLSFVQDGHGNEISIYLPMKMQACVAVIVEAFNAHMREPDAAPMVNMSRMFHVGGGAEGISFTAPSDAKTATMWAGGGGGENETVTINLPDDLSSVTVGKGGGSGEAAATGMSINPTTGYLRPVSFPTGSATSVDVAISQAQELADLFDKDAIAAVERRDLP